MTVRTATVEDIPALVEMGERFHAMSPHKFMGEYRPEAVANMLAYMAANAILLTNGAGVIGGVLAPVYFNPGVLMAEESFWWSAARGSDLLEAFESAARDRGAAFVLLSTLHNERSHIIDRVVSRRGYAPVERRYIKELV